MRSEELEICDEAKGVVHWFGVSGDSFPDVHYLGAFDMGDTKESFDTAWNKHISHLWEQYPLILREDQAQGLAIDLLDALEELTQQRVRGEVE